MPETLPSPPRIPGTACSRDAATAARADRLLAAQIAPQRGVTEPQPGAR